MNDKIMIKLPNFASSYTAEANAVLANAVLCITWNKIQETFTPFSPTFFILLQSLKQTNSNDTIMIEIQSCIKKDYLLLAGCQAT